GFAAVGAELLLLGHRSAALGAELPGLDAGVALGAGDVAHRALLLRLRLTHADLALLLVLLAHLLRHGEADAHAGAAEHRVAALAAAALGHPLAGAHHRLAGGELLVVVQVAAHHAELRGVLVHGLQLRLVLFLHVDDEVAHADDLHAVVDQVRLDRL